MKREVLEKLQQIKTLPSLIKYLRDELEWPISPDAIEDDVTFSYSAEEFGLGKEYEEIVKDIKQIRPLDSKQPWGIFWINFDKKRLPVVILRRILGHLVVKRRSGARNATQASWNKHDLLFISSYGEEQDRAVTFAHFSENPENPDDLPALKVLGWDDSDTHPHLEDAHQTLKEKLRWPTNTNDIAKWRQDWSSAFVLGHREVIDTTEKLVEELAKLAKSIFKRANTAIKREAEKGPLRRLHKAFKESLIHDLEEEDFADVIAQTISYGLLTARFSREDKITVNNLVEMVQPTNPFLRELLGTFLHLAGRKGLFDFDELGIRDVVDLLNHANIKAIKNDFGNRARGEDPVIHFYEHFLSAYNKKQKIQRGVFYTPQPVVSYIVRSVHNFLKTDFGLEDGLASITTWREMAKRNKKLKIPEGVEPDSAFVKILDPATGTATFLVEVIDVIYNTMMAKWQKQGMNAKQRIEAWNEYVPDQLLTRLHGYELMMAPYSIAHMKIGLKLSETEYRFTSAERARVYLTNALEPPQDFSDRLAFDVPALAHEAQAVNAIKKHQCFTVVIGNPPYSDASQNMGKWTAPLIEPFRFFQQEKIKEPGAIRFEHCINNDYVKFWGLTLALFMQTPIAVVCLITSNSFLGGKSFRGVRDAMLRRVNRIEILDLHGEGWAGQLAKQGITDENVFDITTGVAISSLIKFCSNTTPAEVFYGELTGSYEKKASALLDTRKHIARTQVSLEPRHYCQFSSQGESNNEEYWTYPQVDTLFRESVDGIKTSRDGLVIANTHERCKEKILAFARCSAGIEEIERVFFVSAKGFDIRKAQRHLKKNFDERLIYPILYRPFDIRYVYYDKELIVSHRMNVMPSMFHKEAWSLVLASRLSSKGFDHAIACSTLCAHKCASHDINSRMFPVVGLFQSFMGPETLMSNLTDASMKILPLAKGDSENTYASRFGEYIYAILNAPSYRSRYYEYISQDFPRLPMTTNPEIISKLAEKGKSLVKLHTLTEKPPENVFPYSGTSNDTLISPSWENAVLTIGQSSKISVVDHEIWEFNMCGYEACKSWFSAGWKAGIQREGEPLTQFYISQLRTILWSIQETLRFRREIDGVINELGGWPKAFEVKK